MTKDQWVVYGSVLAILFSVFAWAWAFSLQGDDLKRGQEVGTRILRLDFHFGKGRGHE
jgi:hypothetical protein